MQKIKINERDSILQSLKAGVVPKKGLQHIQVGRVNEVKALITDIDRVINNSSFFRMIIGEYGSGKTFFIQLVRIIALQKGLVTFHADLSPERRLYSTGGHARNLYAELIKNTSTRTKPDGNAINSIVERFITNAIKKSKRNGEKINNTIHDLLSDISGLVGGYDFATVIEKYWIGYDTGNETLLHDSIRWLRGEITTKTDAKKLLNVRSYIDDSKFYDQLKILSLFVKQSGYSGMIVFLDEMVNLYKLVNSVTRKSNYEQILRILNDCLQGSAEGLGFLLGGTPEFLFDPRRGLYSYEALQSRLAENAFAQKAQVVDYSSPILHLANLTKEEMYLLLHNIRNVFALGNESKYLVPGKALVAFMNHCSMKIGDAYFRTPRTTIKAFTDFLSILEQNTHLKWSDLIEEVQVVKDINPSSNIDIIDDGDDTSSEFANFNL